MQLLRRHFPQGPGSECNGSTSHHHLLWLTVPHDPSSYCPGRFTPPLAGSGGCFPLHYDNPGPPNKRALTCLLYLNPDWKEGDGGEVCLRPFLGKEKAIAPLLDRLVGGPLLLVVVVLAALTVACWPRG